MILLTELLSLFLTACFISRSEFLIEMLLVNKKQLMCIGPTGTGKSLTIANKLSFGMREEYVPNFLMFSARTSANQTQVQKTRLLSRSSLVDVF